MQHRGFIAIVFVIGCATGSVASQLVVPKARAGTTAVRWEYYCGRVAAGTLTTELNKAGEQAWELMTIAPATHTRAFGGDFEVDAFAFCAKRALP